MARALVNIATCDDKRLSIIDPCCGVGTVVIEALDLGFNIKGYELQGNLLYDAIIKGYNDYVGK